jgi:crossover junction endodeoxyribonuclease RusA
MDKISVDVYRRLADYLRNYKPETDGQMNFAVLWNKVGLYNGEVVAKERPRTGKGGHVYTPAATKKFEKDVAKWAKEEGFTPVFFPVKVTLTIHDKTDDPLIRLHSIAGFTYKQTGGDLDNFVKAVMDGLNKVAWQDDRQIVKLEVERRFSFANGFRLEVARAGLSSNEYEQLRKFL